MSGIFFSRPAGRPAHGLLALACTAVSLPDASGADFQDRLFFDPAPTSAINDRFEGFGFNLDLRADYTDRQWNEVIGKRLAESSTGGLSRVRGFSVRDFVPEQSDVAKPKWFQPVQYRVLDHLKAIDNDVFLDNRFEAPAWLGGGDAQTDPAVIATYAQQSARGLGHLVNGRGYTNLKYWSLSNELSTNGGNNWFGKLENNLWQQRMPIYGQYVTAVRQQLDGLGAAADVQIVGGDTIGIGGVLRTSLPYIRDNLDAAVGAYGFHHYPQDDQFWPGNVSFPADNSLDPASPAYWNNPAHYTRWIEQYQLVRQHSMNSDKPLIIGEWGSGAQVRGTLSTFRGINEPGHALFSASRMLAALNGGVDGYNLWELHDMQGSFFYREHGWFKGERDGWAPTEAYETIGLISKFVRKNSTVLSQATPGNNDPSDLIHTAMVQNNDDGSYTLIVTNRGQDDYQTDIRLLGERFSPGYGGDDAFEAKFRRYIVDPTQPTDAAFGDLPDFTDTQWYRNGGMWNQTIPAGSVVIYTTAYDEVAPAAVAGLTLSDIGQGVLLSWAANADDDFAYYRVYRFGEGESLLTQPSFQIGSTIGTDFSFLSGESTDVFVVTAVDTSGNESVIGQSVIPEPAMSWVGVAGLVWLAGRGRRRSVEMP